ncbi:hypothetical protein BDP55DRAFT_636658 [Colletotrichum godetiae]|uniref:Uncharacterized protein n=1 Tax=Colletotrichum godetiae TaxID=1209918 RepID=A0AAJ0AE03_9PEZI|nr:uncharacterized protein BDP55DRAFT_636658 [Colletotrichum godetiae]KAK1659831.1 hypothetical protein BDP55DRAFT_636658 [Colletotrichum godetiae]
MSTLKEYRPMHKAEMAVYGRIYPEIIEEDIKRTGVYIEIFDTVVVIEMEEDIAIPKADFDQTMANQQVQGRTDNESQFITVKSFGTGLTRTIRVSTQIRNNEIRQQSEGCASSAIKDLRRASQLARQGEAQESGKLFKAKDADVSKVQELQESANTKAVDRSRDFAAEFAENISEGVSQADSQG